MKRYRIVGAAVALLAAVAVEAHAGAVIAPVYPGAVPDTAAGDVTVRVYLSHDPLKKVTAWYSAKVGAMSKSAAITLWNADSVETNTGRPLGETDPKVDIERLGRVLMTQSEVVRALKDMTQTKDIGVLCEGMDIKPMQSNAAGGAQEAAGGDATTQQLAQMQRQLLQAERGMTASLTPEDRAIDRMGDLFEVMRTEALGGRYGHTKQQLLAVYAKYKHLETSWYPTVKSSDGLVSYDRWLLARERQQAAQQDSAGSGDMRALAARIQAAAAAGRMDEVEALSQQAQQGGSTPASATLLHDQWDHWLAVLKKLDAHAYRTRIEINTQPKSWGY